MNSWARWTVRILVMGFGLMIGLIFAVLAVASAFDLGDAVDGASSQARALSVAGNLLIAIGFLGMSGTLAFRRDWASLGQVSALRAHVPGGRQGLRRARRQIDGVEPYRDDEIAHLRWFAEYRVASRRWSRATWWSWVSIISFQGGYALVPIDSRNESVLAPEFALALKILAGVMSLVFISGVVAKLLMRNDVKAEAFLRRTETVPWPADGST